MTQRNVPIDIFRGIFLVIVCDIAYIVTAFFTIGSGYADDLLLRWFPNDGYRQLTALFWMISGTGLVQLLYVVPLYWFFRRKRRPEIAKGMVIMAGLVLLLTAACFLRLM